jgi:hypothetical protein
VVGVLADVLVTGNYGGLVDGSMFGAPGVLLGIVRKQSQLDYCGWPLPGACCGYDRGAGAPSSSVFTQPSALWLTSTEPN